MKIIIEYENISFTAVDFDTYYQIYYSLSENPTHYKHESLRIEHNGYRRGQYSK